ncbi:MAG: YhgE/Pip domain-containing protein [Bacilli bacterium]|nr:YhgE/Pip domain-containing protein [Bacilli bacterium]
MRKIKRDSQMMKLMVILGIIILPLIYSLFYLKGFWDPYNELNHIPVALVNLDECEKNCKSTELIDTLKDKDIFDFKIVDKKKADKGLVDKEYYAVLEIPKNFTADLNNAASKDRKPVIITFKPNSKTNYLASQIITSAVNGIQAELQSQVDKEVVLQLTDNLQSVPTQTKQIGEGLGTIHSGTNTLNNGAKELKNGATSLSTNYKTFNNGVEKLASGANTLYNSYADLNNGIKTAYDGVMTLKNKTAGLETIVNKVNELKNGSNQVTTGLNSYKTNADAMIDDTMNVYDAIKAYCSTNDCMTNPYLKGAYTAAIGYTTPDASGYNGLQQLKGGLATIVTGNNSVNNGINLMASGTANLGELKGGIDQLQAGLGTLKDGSNKVYLGISELNSGLATLNSSSNLIDNGINKIDNGINTLANGTNTLNSGVATAQKTINEKVQSISEQTSELTGLDNYAKEPVKIHEENYGDVKDYGTFFSPYFMSLSLWVGGILILMGLYYDPDQRFKTLGRNSDNRGKRLLYYNIISIVQAIILGFLLKVILGFEVTNIFLYYGSCILISGAFLAVVMFLFFNFKDIGKFLSLVFLVTQLASCGGTFPIQTEPSIYQAIYPYMPMTYSVDLLRESFVSINSSLLIKDVVVLLIFFVLFNGLTFLTSMLKSRKEKGKIAELEIQKKGKKANKGQKEK